MNGLPENTKMTAAWFENFSFTFILVFSFLINAKLIDIYTGSIDDKKVPSRHLM